MADIKRPYLVIPKLIEQPTWGGTYIVESKQWTSRSEFADKKIGQSYELYDKSNLSLRTRSDDTAFTGELADNISVQEQSTVAGSLPLSTLIAENPAAVLGEQIVKTYGEKMHLLLKFTQALGNSFQLHVPDGTTLGKWLPKPESWYYFEPGLITCGVKPGVWDAYKDAMIALDTAIQAVASTVRAGELSYEDAKQQVATLIKQYDPWQYVNVVRVPAGTLLDLSPCGIHHSWEEDLTTIPLGNVLYEIQLNVMDDVATLRSFDKGKMSADGKLRALQIDDYFTAADRSEKANDPATHMRSAEMIKQTDAYTHERLLSSKYYSMDRMQMNAATTVFETTFDTFRHVFVQSGSIDLTAGDTTLSVGAGHSAFVPASCGKMTFTHATEHTQVLVSY